MHVRSGNASMCHGQLIYFVVDCGRLVATELRTMNTLAGSHSFTVVHTEVK